MKTNNNLAYLIHQNNSSSEVFFQVRVTGIAGEWFLLSDSLNCDRAKVSASCLLKPEVGDQVLVFNGKPNAFILTILVRANHQQSASIELPANCEIMCPEGQVTVNSQSIQLSAQDGIELDSTCVSVKSKTTEIRSDQLHGWFAQIDAKTIGMRLVATQVSTVFGRLIHRAKESFRWIESKDETRAGRLRIQAQENVQITSKHASIRAKGYVKIDGQKIDLG